MKFILIVIIFLLSNSYLCAQNKEPDYVLQIGNIYSEVKKNIKTQDKLSTNYTGTKDEVKWKTNHTAYFSKNKSFNRQKNILIESKVEFKIIGTLGEGVRYSEYLWDNGKLIFSYRSEIVEGDAGSEFRCYFKDEKLIHAQGDFTDDSEKKEICQSLQKEGKDMEKAIANLYSVDNAY